MTTVIRATHVGVTPHNTYSDEHVTLWHGDCLDVLAGLPDASVDAVVTDPPYGLEFMGRKWDRDAGFLESLSATGRGSRVATERGSGHSTSAGPYLAAGVDSVRVAGRPFQAWCEQWAAECLRVLKPGGMMLSFGGTRTWHRLVCAIEDSGFEVRDSIAWLYGSGFSKGGLLGNKAGLEWCECGPNALPGPHEPLDDGARRGRVGCPRCGGLDPVFRGFSTTLKPAFEPVVVARKPLAGGTVAANVLEHGTGALNIDACRVGDGSDRSSGGCSGQSGYSGGWNNSFPRPQGGRWPTNVVLDDTQAAVLDEQSGASTSRVGKSRGAKAGDGWGMTATGAEYADTGGASRFFYVTKADASERPRVNGTAHPTVKPLDLMRWLVRLVTPPGGTVLEPFAGSGTTVEACIVEGFHCIAIEREAEYLPLIEQRIYRRRDPVAAIRLAGDDLGLFDTEWEATS